MKRLEFSYDLDLLRCGFVCEGVKKGIVKNWEKPEESETDEDDLDIGISRNRESWRLDGRGKVKDLLKFLFLWRQR